MGSVEALANAVLFLPAALLATLATGRRLLTLLAGSMLSAVIG